MNRLNTIFDPILAFCYTLGIRVEFLYQRVVRIDAEQVTVNQGLFDNLAGAHKRIWRS